MPNKMHAVWRILRAIADAYDNDYTKHFKQNFDLAYTLTDQEAIPASIELRNAFDHFAMATRCATRLRRSSNPRQRKKLLHCGRLNVARARRHIAVGDYRGAEIATAFRIDTIRTTIESVEKKQKRDLDFQRHELHRFTKRFKQVPQPPADLSDDIDLLVERINTTYDYVDRILRVDARLNELFLSIYETQMNLSPKKRAQIAYLRTLPAVTAPP
jgi:hypothetical protein